MDFSQEKRKIAQDIYEANVAMIDSADIVIANLSSFRGKEADTGTVWECGYAHAKGKKVYGYMDRKGTYIEQFDSKRQDEGMFWDEEDRFIEDFEHSINLMVACSSIEIIHGTFEDILKKLVK